MIKNIICDFGNVLGNVDFERFQKNILAEVGDIKLLERLLINPIRKQYETGLISSKEFLDNVVKLLDNRITRKKFTFYYTGMLSEIPEMKRFLIRLSKTGKFKLFLLSNTNPIHRNFAIKKFDYLRLVDRFALSYKLKMMKPDPAIYLAVLNKYHLKPEETIFIDDLESNCLTARMLGMNVIHYRGFRSFNKKFRSLTRAN